MLKDEVKTLSGENAVLRGEVKTLSGENAVLRGEVKTLSGENAVLKGLYKTVQEKMSKLDQENTVLKNNSDILRSDVDMLKSTLMSKTGQCSIEQESDFAGGGKENYVDTEADLVGATNLGGGNPISTGRKPKAQKRREQNETFRNWRKLMTQRKTSEDLWASGLLKFTIELWEDDNISMDGEQILIFVKKNVEQLTTYISSEESKEKFFLTIIKICSMRDVSKPKFQEIMLCFENRGPRKIPITETEIQKFIKMYEGYKDRCKH